MCEREKASTSVRPVLSATTGTRAATASTASTSRRPSATPSTASATTSTDVVAGEVVEHLREADVHRVPEPDAETDAEPLAGGLERERVVDPAALRDDREAAGRELRRRPDEARTEPGGRVEEARGVRAEDPEPGLAAERRERRLELLALGTRLGPAARMDDRGADARLGALGERAGHGRDRDREQRQVDRLRERRRSVRSRVARRRSSPRGFTANDAGCGR